jgi:hypothetical protein
MLFLLFAAIISQKLDGQTQKLNNNIITSPCADLGIKSSSTILYNSIIQIIVFNKNLFGDFSFFLVVVANNLFTI